MTALILPNDPTFSETLEMSAMLLKAKTDTALVQDSSTGLYREATASEVFDYFYGGEYEETLDRFGND